MRTAFLTAFLFLLSSSAFAREPAVLHEVSVGMYLMDITQIDEISNTFTAELQVFVSWQDPELVFDPEAEGSVSRIYTGNEVTKFRSQIWTAQIFPTNPVGQFGAGGEKMIVHADGRAELSARITTTLRANLDFRNFPFDTQVLPFEMESFPWNRDQVRLVPNEKQSGFAPLYALTEWEVTGLEIEQYDVERVRDVVPFSNLAFNISVKRDSGFYLWKIFLTVMIIVSLTWVVFWMSSEGLGRRAGVSSGGILTVIAYQFVTTSSLPRVSYLTIADKVMILSVVIIAATMVQSVMVDGLTRSNMEKKIKIDRICQMAFPAVYFLVLAILAYSSNVGG